MGVKEGSGVGEGPSRVASGVAVAGTSVGVLLGRGVGEGRASCFWGTKTASPGGENAYLIFACHSEMRQATRSLTAGIWYTPKPTMRSPPMKSADRIKNFRIDGQKTMISVPYPGFSQSVGELTGVTQRNSHFASSGRRLTHPRLIGQPKLLCQ